MGFNPRFLDGERQRRGATVERVRPRVNPRSATFRSADPIRGLEAHGYHRSIAPRFDPLSPAERRIRCRGSAGAVQNNRQLGDAPVARGKTRFLHQQKQNALSPRLIFSYVPIDN